MYRFYLRALGISTLKNVLFILFSIAAAMFFLLNVPNIMYQALTLAVFFGLAFLFGEWVYRKSKLRLRQAVFVALAMYFWDLFISILVWSWILDDNLFFKQRLIDQLIFIPLHLIACVAAWYAGKRMRVAHNLAEGLEA
jgi:hypothetical protein